MDQTNVGIDYVACIEGCGRANWHLEQAARQMLEPCNAAIFMDGTSPDHVLNTITTALLEVTTLWEQFRVAALKEPTP